MQNVVDDQGAVDVQLKVSVHSSDVHCDIISHHLAADHGQGLALGRVHLSGHDGAAWFVLREVKLAESTAGAASKPANVVSDLVQGASEGLQGSVKGNQRIAATKGLKLVLAGDKGEAGELEDGGGTLDRIVLVGVEAGANSGSAEGQLVHVGKGILDVPQAMVELGNIAGELLLKGEGGGILEMGPSNLDDITVPWEKKR